MDQGLCIELQEEVSSRSNFIFVDGETFFPQSPFPFCIIAIIQGLKAGCTANNELPTPVLQLSLGFLLLVKKSAGPFILCFCLKPVCIARDALNFLRVLFSIIVFLIDLNSLLDHVHNITYSIILNSKYNTSFKIIQMDTFTYSGLSCFQERPSESTRFLINRQLPKLIDIAISESLQFINTAQTKERALKQLKYTVLIAEKEIRGHLQKIMRALVKIWQSQIQDGEKTIQQIVIIIGYYLSSDFYLPLVLDMLGAEDIRTSPKNTVILLKLIAFMLQKTEDIGAHISELSKLISTYEAQFLDNDDGLTTVSQIAFNLINRLPSLQEPKLVSTLFSVLLNVQATKTIPATHQKQTEQAMKMLASKAGHGSIAELHSNQVGPTLSKLAEGKQYTHWMKTSKDRFKFDAIVRNCQNQAVKFLPQILSVMQYCISLECDIEVRMDTLVLFETMLQQKNVREALKEQAVRVMNKLLNTAIKWKVGKPQIKIRKAGVINMIRMIEQEVIDADQLLECFDEILPQIKNCISDDWAPQLRLACCQFLEQFLMAARDVVDGDHLRELYVILLQRLDDSQDPIRKKTTTAINLFFLTKYLPLTASVSSILEYMINAIFVHYDDSNSEIRDAINLSLRYAARVDPAQVLKQAQANLGRMKHQEQCNQLIEFCKEQIQERKV